MRSSKRRPSVAITDLLEAATAQAAIETTSVLWIATYLAKLMGDVHGGRFVPRISHQDEMIVIYRATDTERARPGREPV